MYTEHHSVVSFFVGSAISNSFLCFTTGNNRAVVRVIYKTSCYIQRLCGLLICAMQYLTKKFWNPFLLSWSYRIALDLGVADHLSELCKVCPMRLPTLSAQMTLDSWLCSSLKLDVLQCSYKYTTIHSVEEHGKYPQKLSHLLVQQTKAFL